MKFLKVMLVITLLLANYSATAHAFAGKHDCAEHMADKGHMTDSGMKDCCKDMAAKMKQCSCGACGSCVAVAAILLAGIGITPPAVADIQSAEPAAFLPGLGSSPNLRPPDLLA
ncbi:MAG: hypothetical protein PSY14_06560 [bacterium]|nr:hypothetical protein [bacterium]